MSNAAPKIQKKDISYITFVIGISIILTFVLVLIVAKIQNYLTIIPIFWSVVITSLTYIVMTLWTWVRPESFIFEGAKTKKKWRDLRMWGTFAMSIQIVLYIVFN